jgi:hypothetical protein
MRVSLTLAIVVLIAPPTIAANFEALSGSAILTRAGQKYRAGRGTQFYEADLVQVPRELQFIGDIGAFFAIAKNGYLQFPLLRREGGCIRNTIVYAGFLSLVPRHFSCKSSLLQVVSANFGVAYTFKGTSATLIDGPDAAYLAVSKGTVVAENLGKSVTVGAGFGNRNAAGQPPGQPVKLDPNLTLSIKKKNVLPWGVEFQTKTNPLNSVEIRGAKKLGANLLGWRFETLGNSIRATVRSPFGERRDYFFERVPRKSGL